MSSKRVTRNDDGTVTVQLKYPVDTGSKVINSVTLRTECTVADLEEMDAGRNDVDKTIRLISELSAVAADKPGVSPAQIRRMRSADYLLLAKEAGKSIGGDDDEENDGGGKESRPTGVSS